MFYDSSDENPPESLSFIVLVWEKVVKKRVIYKVGNHLIRKKRSEQIQRHIPQNMNLEEEFMPLREVRIKRFANYFLTLFD